MAADKVALNTVAARQDGICLAEFLVARGYCGAWVQVALVVVQYRAHQSFIYRAA